VLARRHVELVTVPIDAIVPEGMRTRGGGTGAGETGLI
jgi:hypothetical protein